VASEFGRSSFDARGGVLKLRIHAVDPVTGDGNNALWYDDEQRIWLGDGDGVLFSPFGGGADVIAHELFHGVVDSEARMRYVGQEGALHESFADVLATGIDGNWTIGEDVYTPNTPGDALRDLAHLPHTDWRTFPAGEDEVHAMSEVPSHAAFLVGRAVGMVEMRRIWYAALTGTLRNHSGFAGARDATIAAARTLYGARSSQAQAVTDAWAAVGIDATTPKT
jgi:Zn-dependent metalloprotease